MKRTLIRANLAWVLVLSILLSACSSDAGEQAASKVEVSAAGELPITSEKTTIRIMTTSNSYIEDYTTNDFTKYLEDQTNVHIEWDLVPASSAAEKLNVVLASGDLPDVIMGMNVSNDQQAMYGQQGTFLPLNDLIEKYGVETKKMFEQRPLVKESITSADGNIYALPSPNECYQCSMRQKMWIYQPWLDKLGLQMPTTTEEFYKVLKAFKTEDPNGNGKADEIPMSGAPIAQGANAVTSIENFLVNSFTYAPYTRIYLDNGKATVPYNQEGWKEGLKYLHTLYQEGLIDPQAFTQDASQLLKLGENPEIPILGASSASNMSAITQLSGSSGRWLDYVAVPPLKGPSGQAITPIDPYQVGGGAYVITSSSANPEVAFRLADLLYSQDMTLRSNYGVEDRDWKYVNGEETGLNGKPAIFKELIKFGVTQNAHWAQMGPSFRTNELRLGAAVDKENPLESILYKETKEKYEPFKQDTANVMPPLFFTADQTSEMADLSKTLWDYVNEMNARFVTGDQDIDQGWNDYLQTLEGMGLPRYLEIYQQVYDAKQQQTAN